DAEKPEDSRQILKDLRKELEQLPPEVASNLIRSFLALHKDASTKLNVTIAPGGHLADASSLRVFLFDYLGQIDRPAAGKIAAEVLAQYTTPDEWAINLRNYAWAHPEDSARPFLQNKAQELISNPEWRSNPTSGFLEAFDTLVYAHATAVTPTLTEMIRDSE